MKYDKLIRDNIPTIIESNGAIAKVKYAKDDSEYENYLYLKLIEEVFEFKANPSLEEYADITEVLDAIAIHFNFSYDAFEKIKDNKYEEKGGFKDRIILKEVTDE